MSNLGGGGDAKLAGVCLKSAGFGVSGGHHGEGKELKISPKTSGIFGFGVFHL